MSHALSPLLPLMRSGLDPVPELGGVRGGQPVARLQIPRGPGAWLVTRYDDVRAVLADSGRFGNDLHRLTDPHAREIVAQWQPGGLGSQDPPEHTRLRRLLTPEFSAHRLRQLRPRIEAIVAGQLQAMEQAGPPADLVESFALPIPSLVICELLGIPEGERARFAGTGSRRFGYSGDPATSLTALRTSVGHMAGLVARQRRNPGRGLLGKLIREHGEVTDRELAGLADGLMTGGHDTTASMIALGTLLLLQQRGRPAFLDDRGQELARFIEELLRYISVVQVAFPRCTRGDVVVSGQRIAAGEPVLCSLSAANRDAGLGGRMERFVPDRAATPHLAFGYGRHRCIGAELARLEMSIAFPALLRRFPGLRLAVPAGQIPFRRFSIVYGVNALPVTW